MKRDFWLWTAIALGPATWFVLLTAGYYAVPPAHIYDREWFLRGITLASIVVVLISAVIGVRELKLTSGDTGDVLVQRRRFLALCSLGFTAISLLLVIGMTLTTFLLSPGAEP